MTRDEARALMQAFLSAQERANNAYKILTVTPKESADYAGNLERYEDALDKEVAAHEQIVVALSQGANQ